MEEKELFQKAYQVESELAMLKDDLKDIKSTFTYHAEHNSSGLDKEVVKKVMRAAKAKAAQDNLRDKAEELNEIAEIQDKYS